jgi:hypothetical protein
MVGGMLGATAPGTGDGGVGLMTGTGGVVVVVGIGLADG